MHAPDSGQSQSIQEESTSKRKKKRNDFKVENLAYEVRIYICAVPIDVLVPAALPEIV